MKLKIQDVSCEIISHLAYILNNLDFKAATVTEKKTIVGDLNRSNWILFQPLDVPSNFVDGMFGNGVLPSLLLLFFLTSHITQNLSSLKPPPKIQTTDKNVNKNQNKTKYPEKEIFHLLFPFAEYW